MLSVIITVFEQRTSLEMLLYCLRTQDIDEPFEVLICDDGSSPELFSAIRTNSDLAGLDIRYIWQSKNGHRAARSKNNGIRCAQSDLLVFLDGDILVRPDFLNRHRSAHHFTKQIVCNPRRWVLGSRRSLGVTAAQRRSDSRALLPELVALAKNDIRSLFELLEKVSFDVDRLGQQKLFSSNAPWMACVGFSFSINRGPEVYFDENFEGWGPEDREFALRMVKRNGYGISFLEEIEVFHLEGCSTGRPSFSLYPNSAPHILSFLRNMVYLCALYPDEDLSRLMTPLMAYRLNPVQQCWELASDVKPARAWSAEDLTAQISSIEQWLRANSVFPKMR